MGVVLSGSVQPRLEARLACESPPAVLTAPHQQQRPAHRRCCHASRSDVDGCAAE